MADFSFVLVTDARPLPTKKVIAAAKRRGFTLSHDAADRDGPQTFRLAGDGNPSLVTMVMPAPHPDAAGMATGLTSPTPEVFERAKAHFIVTTLGSTGDERARDRTLGLLTAAVIEALGARALAAMLGHGHTFHRAEVFRDLADLAIDAAELPCELAIDVTAARESETHMSFLTHNLVRYGREELYVRCPIKGQGATDFVLGIARWLLTDRDKQLPTGETIGRTATEKVKIQRVPNPTGSGPPVIFLDLP